jgi:hypothetical protein
MRHFGFLFFCFFFFPFLVQASGRADLSIERKGISFSEDTLIAGDTVRIYAQIKNIGEVDVAGYVLFYQGGLPIGNSQVISVRADSAAEEVYVDFVVPTGSFNIRAEIKDTDPEDSNSSNNSAITALLTPVLDDDRDGIVNDEDNCPGTVNPEQTDTDVDGLGDDCDDDDDDDGLTDGQERVVGSDSLKTDTDKDGLLDAADPHPTVPESEVAPVPVVVAPAPIIPSLISGNNVINVGGADGLSDSNEVLISEDTVSESPANIKTNNGDNKIQENQSGTTTVSPNAAFSYQVLGWNSYRFIAQIPSGSNYRVNWNFGDGATSNKTQVDHLFPGAGDYAIKVQIENPDGTTAEDSVIINIPFFSLQNRTIQFLLTFLGFCLVAAIQIFVRLVWKKFKVVKKAPNTPRRLLVRREND